ncbi:MAG TPA: polysaccharide deacetylase family protein, partial [Bacteroidales bacterium]
RIFVTRRNLEKHFRFFKLRGLTSITFKDYLEFASGNKPVSQFPRKPFILTFDDGYRDNFVNMLPLAQKYGLKGVLFLLGDFSVTANFWDAGEDKETNKLMTLEQKKAFVEAGWEIGAHTLSHPDLTKLSQEESNYEIATSKIRVEENLQSHVVSFAYPFGFYNDEIKDLVRNTGFEFGIATDTGGMTIEEDRFAVFRINIFPEENIFQLYKKTSTWYRAYYRRKRGK